MTTLIYIRDLTKDDSRRHHGQYIQFQYRNKMIQGRLCQDYNEINDGIYWMHQKSLGMKARYSQQELTQRDLYRNGTILEDGEIVEIQRIIDDGDSLRDDGKGLYKFRVYGDCSDAGIFEKVS